MAKDPAFLFYSQDFFTGVSTISFEDRGKYITILCIMHQQGRLSEETIRLLVGSVSDSLKSKFQVDAAGLWFNERLEAEIAKRNDYVESRRLNGLKGGRPITNHKVIHKDTHKGNHSEDENVNEDIKLIIEYLNEKTHASFSPKTSNTVKHISARISEGRTIDDFKKVIDTKVTEWLGTEQAKYLRPDTLFGSKFEAYLNQQVIEKVKKEPIKTAWDE